MNTQGISKKRVVAFALSMLLIMQQSFALQVLSTTITDGAGNKINPNGGDNVWNVRPDAANGDVGFKQFGKIDLTQGDILNFIYSYIKQDLHVEPDASATGGTKIVDNYSENALNTIVALVNQGVNINGIVNALQANGALKNDGNLMFITPGGFVVGASGVLNVGNLSVVTPTQDSYNSLKNYLNLPQTQKYFQTNAELTQGDPTKFTSQDDTRLNVAETITKSFDINTLTDGNGNTLAVNPTGVIRIDAGGRVAARGDINLQGGTVTNNGTLLAGIGTGNSQVAGNGVAFNVLDVNNTENSVATTTTDSLFSALVNTDNMGLGNTFIKTNGNIKIASATGTSVGNGAIVRNYGTGNITIENTGVNGISIAGEVSNPNGATKITNTNGQLLVDTTGIIKSGGKLVDSNGNPVNGNSTLLVSNTGAGGMDIQGKVKINHLTKANTVNFINKNSDMTIGSTAVNKNIESNADVNIAVTNGNLLNNGVANTLIYTTNGADLNATVTNGRIGDEVGPNYNCDGGVCTGVGPSGRDLTKSVNTSIDGVITATSTKGANASLINMASLNKDMHVNQIKADGRVILLADDATNKGATAYSIVNRTKDAKNPNVEGTGISLIASGNIGEAKTSTTSAKALTFRQNGYAYNPSRDDAQLPHEIENVNKSGNGVDMLAIGNIDVKGMDDANNNKLDTKACAIISRTGDINAEFSGNVYVGETTAANNINLTTRGKNMYVDHLGEVPSYAEDYYGPNTNIHPTRAKLVALDLGTKWIDSEKPAYKSAADSTIVVKNGTLKGKGEVRPAHEQDLTMVADNAYAGGYYFNMGKHRNGGVSTVVKDSTTNTLTNANNAGTPISIRTKAVRPDDVTAIGQNKDDRNYYYGGSEQGEDQGYDGFTDPSKKGTEEDDDNLVVPKDDEPDYPLDTDTDTDTDTDIDTDTDTDTDIDTDNEDRKSVV